MAKPERTPDLNPGGGTIARALNGLQGPALSRRSVLKAGVFAGTSAALVACAPAQESAAPPASASAGATAAPATAAPTAAAARGGTIRLGAFEGGGIYTFNPWNSFGQFFMWNWCAQRLASVGADGSVLYEAAESHEVSPDGLEYTFHLKPGIKFHDGTPLTAADVAFTWNTCLKVDAGSNSIAFVRPVKGSQAVVDDQSKDAEGIVVVDDLTIKFVLESPSASFMSKSVGVIFIAPKHAYDGTPLAGYKDLDINTKLFIGTGPYRMTEYRDKEFVRFEAYDEFVSGDGFSGLPGADNVSVVIYTEDNAQLVSTEAGDVDFQYFRRPSGDKLARLKSIAGLHTQESLVGLNIFYSFNLDDPSNELIKDKRFRQAMVWALDRQLLVDDVLGGVFKVPDIVNQWIAPWANPTDLERYHPQDVDKAKALLDEIGWVPGTKINVWHYPPKLEDDIPVITAMWEDVGIGSNLTPLADETFTADFYDDPKYDVAFAYGFGTLDGSPWGSDTFLGSNSIPPNGFNSMRFINAEWDTEYAAALVESTQDAQTPHLHRCAQIFNEELPYMPIYQRVDYSVVSDKLKGPEKYQITHPEIGGVKFYEWTIEA